MQYMNAIEEYLKTIVDDLESKMGTPVDTISSDIASIQSSVNALPDFSSTPILNGLEISSLTANRALVSDSAKQIKSSAITDTELSYLDGLISNVQTQINNKTDSMNEYVVVAPTGGDYSKLSDALNANERFIYVKDGTYNEGANYITVTQNGTTIIGSNMNTAKITTSLEFRLYASNCVIKGIQIDSSSGNNAAIVIGDGSVAATPLVDVGSNNLIEECKFKNGSTTFCVYYAGASYTVGEETLTAFDNGNMQYGNIMRNCVMESSFVGDAFVFALQKYGKFDNNTCIGGRIAFYMVDKCTCDYNIITNSNTSGIFFTAPSTNNSVSNNIIVSCSGSGIHVGQQLEHTPLHANTSIYYNTISNNYVINAGYTGINFTAITTNHMKWNSVEENVLINCGDHGIYLLYSEENKVNNNYIVNPYSAPGVSTRGAGIYLVADSTNNEIKYNKVYDIRASGTCCRGGIVNREDTSCTGNNIVGNVLRCNNIERTIWIQSDYNIIKDNEVTGGNYAGIHIAGASHCQIKDNTVYNNTDDANNAYGEIWLTGEADYNIITGNHCEATAANKAKANILDDTTSTHNIFQGNTSYGCYAVHALQIGDYTATLNMPSLTATRMLSLDASKNIISSLQINQDLTTGNTPQFAGLSLIHTPGYSFNTQTTISEVDYKFAIYTGELNGEYGTFIGTRSVHPLFIGVSGTAYMPIKIYTDGTIKLENLTANKVLTLDSNKKITSFYTFDQEVSLASTPTFAGMILNGTTTLSNLTASKVLSLDSNKNIISTYDLNQSLSTSNSPTFTGISIIHTGGYSMTSKTTISETDYEFGFYSGELYGEYGTYIGTKSNHPLFIGVYSGTYLPIKLYTDGTIKLNQLTASKVLTLDSTKTIVSSYDLDQSLATSSSPSFSALTVNKSQIGNTNLEIINTNADATATPALKLTSNGGSSYIFRSSILEESYGADSTHILENGGGSLNFWTNVKAMTVAQGGNISLPGLTASKVLTLDSSKNIVSSYDLDQNLSVSSTPIFAGLNLINSTENYMYITSNGAVYASGIGMSAGDGTTSSRYIYSTITSNETVPQSWGYGMYADKNFSIRDLTNTKFAIVIEPITSKTTIYGDLSLIRTASTLISTLSNLSEAENSYTQMDISCGNSTIGARLKLWAFSPTCTWTSYGLDSSNLAIIQSTNESSGLLISQDGNLPLYLGTNSSINMKINGSGNIGINTTDIEVWDSSFNAIEFIGSSIMIGKSGLDVISLNSNCYKAADNKYYYKSSRKASMFVVSDSGNSGDFAFYTAPEGVANNEITFSKKLYISNIGNMRLGTLTLKDWASGYTVLQSNKNSITTDGAGYLYITSNMYYDGANKYLSDGYASIIEQGGGAFAFKVTSSGTTDASITWTNAFIINNSGNIGINTTDIEAWNSPFGAIEFPTSSIFYGKGIINFLALNNNCYYDNAYRYKTANKVCQLVLGDAGDSGDFIFKVAPSGTIDTSITWKNAMIISNTGKVSISYNTSGGSQFEIAESTTNRFSIDSEASYAGNVINSYNIPLKLKSFFSADTGGTISLITSPDNGSTQYTTIMNKTGNMGFNTTDLESWAPGYAALEFPYSAIMYNKNNPGIYLCENMYSALDTTVKDYYKSTAAASYLVISGGSLSYQSVPSGTADTQITSWQPCFAINNTYGTILLNGATRETTMESGITMKQRVDPTTNTADQVSIYATAGADATLGLCTEATVATETVTSDRTLAVKINGTVYKICLKS